MMEVLDTSMMESIDTYIDSIFTRNLALTHGLMYAIIGLLALAVILLIVVLRRSGANTQTVVDIQTPAAAAAPVQQLAVAAPVTPVLSGINEPTAALVMATLADQLQTPIEQLRFISITQVENAAPVNGSAGELVLRNVSEKTAAFLMAIVADKTQIPVNQLRFLSIKQVD